MGARTPLLGGLEVPTIAFNVNGKRITNEAEEKAPREKLATKAMQDGPPVTIEQVQQAEKGQTLTKLIRYSPKATIDVLYRIYADRLRSAMHNFSNVIRDNDDIVQEAFKLALEKHHLYRGDSAFYTWIYRVAWNTAISKSRGKRNTDTSLDERVMNFGESHYDPTVVDGLERLLKIEDIGVVQHCLAALSQEHQDVIRLRHYDEFSYDAIAELIGTPVGTVRSRLNRARNELKQRILETAVGAALGEKFNGHRKKKQRNGGKGRSQYELTDFSEISQN